MEPVQFGQYPPARRTLLHVSDTHLLAGNRPLGGRFDTGENLRRTLEAVERTGIRPDAIVFTGDLTDLGEPDAYRALREAVEPVAERLGAPIVWVAGNHDERPALRQELLGLDATQEPVTGVWDLGGLRLIALDTTVPGWHHGDLDSDQLDWLRGVLSTPAPLGTILAMHHPPLPSHVPLFDILELRDQGRLADGDRRLRREGDPRGPPALLDERNVRGHPRERGRRHLLHDEPGAPRGRGQRHGCRSVVPPRARLRQHDHPRRRPRRRRAHRRLLLRGVGRADVGADA